MIKYLAFFVFKESLNPVVVYIYVIIKS